MKEIERKFLVDLTKVDLTKHEELTTNIEQGYLAKGSGLTLRIRIQDSKAFITIKGKTKNISRDEYEYEIPVDDAKELLKLCDKTITKKRTMIKFNKKYWSIDVFDGDNEGLVIAEIELKSEDQKFSLPPWVTKEVSNEDKYYNCNLINYPFKKWVEPKPFELSEYQKQVLTELREEFPLLNIEIGTGDRVIVNGDIIKGVIVTDNERDHDMNIAFIMDEIKFEHGKRVDIFYNHFHSKKKD